MIIDHHTDPHSRETGKPLGSGTADDAALVSQAFERGASMNSSSEMMVRDESVIPLLQIRDLRLQLRSKRGSTEILRGINLDIGRGEILGLVGESGCGKSVTWLAVLRVLGQKARTTGSVLFEGSNLLDLKERDMTALRGRRLAMIVQDATASLNPIHTIGFQLAETLVLHRALAWSTARVEAKRLLDRVRIPAAERRLGQYPHELSGGTNQRVAIAMALAGEPDLLIADEPTTGLDVTVQAQILDLLREIRGEMGTSIVLISHDLGVVRETSDRIAVMYAGKLVEMAPSADFWHRSQHPYTRGLLAAAPDIDEPIGRLRAIPGHVPAPNDIPRGCAFQARCAQALPSCSVTSPAIVPVANDHQVACFRAESSNAETAKVKENISA
ncbi:ABC transporter ATP-binding protein [Paraburkholderia aspalathi]|uniref:Peptide/nickel transport system ATP-binding protein n=1 Tax=Paraburkholderia aspalathi TaxID=1324617 RepID=A0A1I7B8V3_9BURK|nr:ABC transporter ATP-binding protein [Paraburkholderia aspalathi]SFT83636.1 peptide/nickel transport system ATP-binding protein [Paraburkholderia aspalathi]